MYQRGTGDNCDKCHLSSGQEKSTSNKGDVIVAFKKHALNLIPSRQLVGKRANSAKTSVWLQSWVDLTIFNKMPSKEHLRWQ